MGGVREKLAYLRPDSGRISTATMRRLRDLEGMPVFLEYLTRWRWSRYRRSLRSTSGHGCRLGWVKELYGIGAEVRGVGCPNCHEPVSVEEDFLYDDDIELSCPECGETLYPADDDDDLDDIFLDDEDDED